jgi:N utilization substance protein B
MILIKMISRRLIRIKVLQELYACMNSAKTIENAEKELMFSISKAYELYHHFLCLPIVLANYAAQQIVLGKQKIHPTEGERNPNTKFSDNSFVQKLRQHNLLKSYEERNKFIWQPDIIKKIYRSLKNAEYFQNYMQNMNDSSSAEDKMLVIKILENEVEDNEELYASLEEQSVYWTDVVEYSLSHAIKSCRMLSIEEENFLLPMFKDSADEQFTHMLFLTAAMHRSEYRHIVEKHAQNWEVERIAMMDIVIMIVAIAELITFASIPVNVTLNEYIEISKYYSTPQSSLFINGILDKIVAELNEQKLISKYYKVDI